MFMKNKVINTVLWVIIFVTFVVIINVIILAFISSQSLPSASFANNPLSTKLDQKSMSSPTSENDENIVNLLNKYIDYASTSFLYMQHTLLLLTGTLIFTLILIGAQMYMWLLDRRKLKRWKRSGFFCDHLEFLSANRIRINDIELELNKAQIDTLNLLTQQRLSNELLHNLEIGTKGNGAQSIKRLREELGAKLMEKTLIKVRKCEGYWIEIDPDNIHDSRS